MSVTDDFKSAFRDHPTGVAIITAIGPDGPVGLTASSVASVSTAPTALSFSVSGAGESARALLAADRFAVNLLGVQHAHLAGRFAVSGTERFTADEPWIFRDGMPELADAPAVLVCRPMATMPVGTSVLVVGEVETVTPGPATEPLIHHHRRFHALGQTLPTTGTQSGHQSRVGKERSA
ncbi:flavin reductase family protein [Dermacoccaceae bacterium W4C1]